LLKTRGLLPKLDAALDAFCLIEDEALRSSSLELIQRLRSEGCAVDYSLTPLKADKQFKRALELNARCTARLEKSPSGEHLVRVKNLRTREEVSVPIEKAAEQIKPGR
jgi:histidyl-tRNA synthetase